MDVNMYQGLVQQQKLVLTVQMQQSLKLLQMPICDLQVDIAKQLEENPLLEINSDENITHELNEFQNVIDPKQNADHEYTYSDNITYDPDNKVDPLNFIVENKTLKEYLKDQLVDLIVSPFVLVICNYIIENIDERGYLSCSIEDIAKDLDSTESKTKYALELIQNFEPYGVAARDLIECLQIQLRKREIDDENLHKIIEHHLEHIADNKLKKISCMLNVSVEKVQEYCNIIKTLEPKPSRGFYTGSVDHYIIPEAYIRIVDHKLVVFSNNSVLPILTVNKTYKNLLKKETDIDTTEFVKSKLNSAVNLIKGIEQRNCTIHRILEILIEKQHDYFYYGPHYLKPMIIGEIAEELDLNESTVSRAIKDKYISTPHSTVKIRNLFTYGLKSSTSSDDTISSNSVKTQIKDLIDSEDKLNPLSDEVLSKILNEKGLKIARRTVAKYREEMEILSSGKRKIFK